MTDTSPITSMKPRSASLLPWVIAAGSFAFAVGTAGMFVYTQSQQAARTDALEALTLQVIGMQQENAAVTRAASTGLLAVAPAAVAQAEEPETQTSVLNGIETTVVQAVDASDANTADLEDRITEARAVAAQIKLDRLSQGTVAQMLTDGILSGAYDVDARVVNGQSAGVALVPQGLNNTTGILADLIATSVDAGEIQVPDYIPRNADGNVDSQTLLFDLVQRSLENGTAEEIAAAGELRQRTVDAFAERLDDAPSAAAPTPAGEDRFYVVEAGDNLAYIALQFYGSTSSYGVIFEANRDVISAPDRILIGQRLRIPNV